MLMQEQLLACQSRNDCIEKIWKTSSQKPDKKRRMQQKCDQTRYLNPNHTIGHQYEPRVIRSDVLSFLRIGCLYHFYCPFLTYESIYV
jgi:hypothetical protein